MGLSPIIATWHCVSEDKSENWTFVAFYTSVSRYTFSLTPCHLAVSRTYSSGVQKIAQNNTIKGLQTDRHDHLFHRGRFEIHIETRVVWCPCDVSPFAVLLVENCYDLYDFKIKTHISHVYSTFQWR